MTVYVVFAIAPNPIKYGETTYFFGNVNEDGEPVTEQKVEIYEVFDGSTNKLFDLSTDMNGDFVVDWNPPDTWIGKHTMQAFVPLYAGYWSDEVILTVTNEVADEFPVKALMAGSLLGLVALFAVTRRK